MVFFLKSTFIFIFMSSLAYAIDHKCKTDQLLLIQSIELSGNTKTNSKVILNEFAIKQNDEVCEHQIVEAINRIKRTGLFSSVKYEIFNASESNNKVTTRISVSERWTTIPILKINSGGGVSQYTLGVYDPNINGTYLEAGAQYENLAGANSGVLWFKNPRLFGLRQGIDLQYWNTKRVRIKYDQDVDNPEIKTGFLHEREKIYADYFREIATDTTVRLSFDYNKDSFSSKVLPDSVIKVTGPNPELPPATKLILTKIGYELGRIDGDPQALNGQVLGVYFGYAHPLDSKLKSFTQTDLNFHFYRAFSNEWQFAQRFLAGSTTTKILQYWYYLGGLDRIRGFADNRFSGRYFGLSNSEIRYLIYEKSSALIQTVGFLDLASVGEEASSFTSLKAASVGGGARIILPKFYRFVVRLDYAKPIQKKDDMNWSFGVQQFF